MNLRLEENYLVSTLHGHVCMDECSCTLVSRIFLSTRRAFAPIFFPYVLPSPPKAKPTSCAVFPIPQLGIIPYLTRMDLDYLLQATINPLLPILSRAHPRNLSQQLRQRSRSRRSLMMRRFHLTDLFSEFLGSA